MRTDPSTTLVDYFADELAGKIGQQKRSAIGALSRMVGHAACLADLQEGTDVRLADWLVASKKRSGTIASYVSMLRGLWILAARRGDVVPLGRQVDNNPDKWHRKPPGHKNKTCPICGCPAHATGEHRLATPDESSRKWLKRKNVDDGYLEQEVGAPFVRRHMRMPTGPTAETLKLIARAATLQAAGKTWKQIAAALEITPAMVGEWRRVYAPLWKTAFAHAIEQNAKLVLALAGTDDALKLVNMFIDASPGAAKAIQAKIEGPLPERLTAENTLTEFFRGYFLPVCLSEVCKLQVDNYKRAMRAWYLFTGDPKLKDITAPTLATYRDRVVRLPNLRRLGYISPVTVNAYLRWVQTILDRSGPPYRGFRDAAGILDRTPPWIRRPLAIGKAPRIVSPETLNQLYAALVAAELPRVEGIRAPQWWRSLIVVAALTGLRKRSLFGLRIDDIDWEKRRLLIRPTNNKTRRTLSIHLHEAAYRHLWDVCTRRDREKVFPWPHGDRWYFVAFHKLQDAAGIPRADHFGLHNLRKTLATLLFEHSPGAAQLALGHSSGRVTQQHYVQPDAIVSRAIDALPLPSAFTGGKAGAA